MNVVLPYDGDLARLRARLDALGFELGERPNAPLFARGPGVAIHAYRTGKMLLTGPRAQEWADALRDAHAPAAGAAAPPAPPRAPRAPRAPAAAPAEAAPPVAGWLMYFDGACEPRNPGGIAAYGYQILRDGRVVHEGHGLAAPPGPGATNNVAEFRALVEGLAWLDAQGARDVTVRGDSRLVVETVNGRWNLKAEHLKAYLEDARAFLRRVGGRLEWVPRELNAEADRLSNVGVREAAAAHPEWRIRLRD